MRRRAGGVGCGARGRGRTYPRSREAPGPDRAVLRPLRREPAGLGPFHLFPDGPRRDQPMRRTGAADRGRKPGRKPGNADLGNRNRRRGAPRGARAPANGARQDGRLVRRLALHPLGFSGGKRKAGAPAPLKNRGDGAWLRGCLKIESGRGARVCAAFHPVVTELVPVTPLRKALCRPKRDGRDKPGHDGVETSLPAIAKGGACPTSASSFIPSTWS